MHPVIIFISTPRCGTQWLAKFLGEIYEDEATVLHEPILYDYYPRLNLGRYELPLQPESNQKLQRHLDFIEEETKQKKYIEVGWQSIAGISEFYHRFRNRLRVIHLYRNPVFVAASLVTIDFYTQKHQDRNEKAILSPFDDVALLDEYKYRWEKLSRYEKSLYYWTEVNLRALEIKYQYGNLPFYSLKFENLFKKNKETSRITLVELLSFMGFNYSKKMLDALNIRHDEYHYKTNSNIDWKKIKDHPQTLALANKLGYRLDEEIELQRYEKTFKQKIASRVPLKIQKAIKLLVPAKIQEVLESIFFLV